jgi:hypothetical protein
MWLLVSRSRWLLAGRGRLPTSVERLVTPLAVSRLLVLFTLMLNAFAFFFFTFLSLAL